MKQLFSKKSSKPSSPTKKSSPYSSPDPNDHSFPDPILPTKSSSSLKSSTLPKLSRSDSEKLRESKPRRSARRGKSDLDTHPLNLPPEERNRRVSALSTAAAASTPAMADRASRGESMDIDRESSVAPSSPVESSQDSSPQHSTPTPSHQTETGETSPVANDSQENTKEDESAPPPPPHRSPPTSPVPSTPEEEAEAFKAAGNKMFKEKNYAQAIEQYSKAVGLFPNSSTYLGNRAAAYMSYGRYEAALDDCLRAAAADPLNQKITNRLARIYTGLGRPEDALMTFDRLQPPASSKDTAAAREMMHHVQSAQSALDSGSGTALVLHALDQAERLLGSGVFRPREWQLMRGDAYLKMGTENAIGQAQSIAASLLRNNNQDPEALVMRGRALYGQGENDKAILHFKNALSCDPDFRLAIRWLKSVQKLERLKAEGNSEYKSGRWQNAVDKYSNALEVDPANRGTNSKLLQNRALCNIKLKKFDDAINDCDRAIALEPQYLKARKTKANALGQAERWEECVQEWKSLHEIDSEDPTIVKEIRRAERELKKSQRKDYYKILQVSKDADEVAIKKAYRKLAIIHHPDKNPNDEQAAERFKDIGEAYETLSDPQKRHRYDSGEDLMDAGDMFGGGGMGGGIDPETFINLMRAQQGGGFGGGGGDPFGGGFGGGGGGGFRSGGFPGQGGGGYSAHHHHSNGGGFQWG